jgi:hypothetical protein
VDRSGRLVGIMARSSRSMTAIAYEDGPGGGYAMDAAALLMVLEGIYELGPLIKELGGPLVRAARVQQVQANATPKETPPAPPSITPAYTYPKLVSSDELVRRHKELLPALVKALSDSDKEIMESAIQALARLGDAAIPTLVQVLQSENATLRVRAAVTLGKMGPYGQAALPKLVAAMQDKEIAVRREAVRAIAHIVDTPPTFVVPNIEAPVMPMQ